MEELIRSDARNAEQLRPTRLTPHYLLHAEGSVLIEAGRTRVICTASIEDRVPPFLRGSGKGWITAEYGMLPRATTTRVTREASKGKVSGRTQEIQRLIGRSLRAAIDLKKLGPRTIWIDCDVLQADGGTRTAAITGSFVALSLAINKLVNEGVILEYPIPHPVAAVSVGVVEGQPMLDLCYVEDAAADVDMNLVMTGAGEYIEVQGSGEEATFSADQLTALLAHGKKGVDELVQLQKAAIEAA